MQTSLYRYFDAANVLLYVGISHHPVARLTAHGGSKDVSDIRYIEIEWFEDQKTARKAEKHAIKRERPLWNIEGKPELRRCAQTWPDEKQNHVCVLWYSPADEEHVLSRAKDIMGGVVSRDQMHRWCGPRDGSRSIL